MVCTSSVREGEVDANGKGPEVPSLGVAVNGNGDASAHRGDLSLPLKVCGEPPDGSTDSEDTASTATAEQEEELLITTNGTSENEKNDASPTGNEGAVTENGIAAPENERVTGNESVANGKANVINANESVSIGNGNVALGNKNAVTESGKDANNGDCAVIRNGSELSGSAKATTSPVRNASIVLSIPPLSRGGATNTSFVRHESCNEQPTERIRFAIGNGFWGSEDDNASMRSRTNTGSVAIVPASTPAAGLPNGAGVGVVDGDDYDLMPPDGGWGWMVLLGTVIVNTLIPGLVKSFGVLFVEFIDMFNATPSSVAWIPAITFSLYNLLGPVASVISTKVSCRFATCLGGLSATIGLLLSYFATSIEFLYFSYGILGGIGAGMSYTPGILIVGQYFNKRRGLANGICASGSALGSIILPPFLNYLLDQYGCRGAILIMCALTLNVCVGAMLYQPVYRHLVKTPRPPPEMLANETDTMQKDCSMANGGVGGASIIGGGTLINTMSATKLEDIEEVPCTPPGGVNGGDENRSFRNRRNDNSFASVTECLSPVGSKRSMLLRRPQSNPRFAQLIGSDSRHLSLSGGAAGDEEQRALLMTRRDELGSPTAQMAANVTSYTASNGGLCMGSSSALGGSTSAAAMHRSPSVISNVSSASFAYLGTAYHGNTAAAYQLNTQIVAGMQRSSLSESRGGGLAAMTTSQSSIGRRTPRHLSFAGGITTAAGTCEEDAANVGSEQPRQQPEKLSMCKMMFDVSLLRNTVFLLITYTVVASGIGYTNLLIILPAYAADLGLGKTQYALLLSVIAGSDLVGRIGGAWASDWARFPCKYLYASGFVVSGVALMLMPQLNSSLEGLIGCCAVFGFASGVYIGLMAVLLVNQLGADKLASSFGLSLAVNGVVMMGGPPIVGAIQEVIGSYEPVIFILGVIILSGGLILVLEPFASAYEKRKLALLLKAEEGPRVSV